MSLTDIWERAEERGASTMSKNLFALSICGFTLAGIIASMVTAQYSKDWKFSNA